MLFMRFTGVEELGAKLSSTAQHHMSKRVIYLKIPSPQGNNHVCHITLEQAYSRRHLRGECGCVHLPVLAKH